MLSSAKLREIISQVRPIIERQLDDAERIAGFRQIVADAGGDWSALKALLKAQAQDERDDAGDGKRVRKILDRAEFASAYADMLGLANMNEDNFSAGEDFDPLVGEITESRPADAPVATEADGPSGDEARQQSEPLSVPSAAQEVGTGDSAASCSSGRTESSADGQQIHESPSINDEASSTAAPQGEAVHSQGTGAETLAGREGRSEGQAASVDLPTLSPATATEPGTEAAGAPAIAEDASRQERSAGAIIFERTPPRPVSRHALNRCWPDRWGMPLAVFSDDIREHGVRKPIVKIGDEILDGWCRYTVARELGIEYPTIQYQGDDPLADSIRWNREGARMLTLNEQRQIAAKLAKVPGNEHRASEILELFGFKAEEAAA